MTPSMITLVLIAAILIDSPRFARFADDPLAGYKPFVCGKQRPIDCYYPALCANRGEANEQCMGKIGSCSPERCWEREYECVKEDYCFERSNVPLTTPKPVQSCGMAMADKVGQLRTSPTLRSYAAGERILNGTLTEPAKWPWMVSLASRENDTHYSHNCGGSVVSERYVLTAVHCVNDWWLQNSTLQDCYLPRDPDALYVLSNVSDYMGGELRPEWVLRRVEQIITHPERRCVMPVPWGCQHTNATCEVPAYTVNDIALLKLTEPYVFGPWTQPVCLSESVVDADGKEVTITGYAADKDDNSGYGILREAMTTLISHANCERNMTSIFDANRTLISRSRHICTLGFTPPNEGGCSIIAANGTCIKYGQVFFGDSGGPMQMRTYGNRWVQLGVAAWIAHIFAPFAKPGTVLPDGWTRLSSYCGWMKEASGGEIQCLPLAG